MFHSWEAMVSFLWFLWKWRCVPSCNVQWTSNLSCMLQKIHVCVTRAPAHRDGGVSAPMADPVILEEPAVTLLWGQWDGARGKFLQIQVGPCRHHKSKIWPLVYLNADFENKHMDFLFWMFKGGMWDGLYLTDCGWKGKLVILLSGRHIGVCFFVISVPFFGSNGQKKKS